MSRALVPGDFSEFYEAVHGVPPFPWQVMLAEQVAERGWPACIDLPTASGKTASIDIAIFALACQADRSIEDRTAPRRVFFVVDRRIVVDAAFLHASDLAARLREAETGILRIVADRLRLIGGSTRPGARPLIVTRMRGGIARDDGWVRSPAQPAVITSTVDQLGSRLLFRGYGRTRSVASIDAALTGNDSLILLDEAHCSVPFAQTTRAVQRYRSSAWAERPIRSPFQTVIMSATPPEGTDPGQIFPAAAERGAALACEELRRRLEATKKAELAIARTPPKPRRGKPGLAGERLSGDVLVLDATDRALKLIATGRQRIAIMVNRVATARAIWRQVLAEASSGRAGTSTDVILMTGRMRPLDRDRIVDHWQPLLKARRNPPELPRPVVLVTTQCLEVGADFSFDALITECASLDALCQRFGRLDRLGTIGDAAAAILIRPEQTRAPEQIAKLAEAGKHDDPVYGNALAATWNWLGERAGDPEEPGAAPSIDFGILALDGRLPPRGAGRQPLLSRLSAPVLDAPVMLPAHVDLWAQTSPRPTPDPEVSLFLHGPERGEPEVSVVFRNDLDGAAEITAGAEVSDAWVQAVSLLPPTTPESFSVPLRLARQWLAAGRADAAVLHDVEGPLAPAEDVERVGRRFVLLWRGREDSLVADNPAQLRPNDVVIVPAVYGLPEAFGDAPRDAHGAGGLDVAEAAFQQARDRAVLRVHPDVLRPWEKHPAVAALLEWSKVADRDLDSDDLADLLAGIAVAPGEPGSADSPALPEWLCKAAETLAGGCEVAVHPGRGYVLSARRRMGLVEETEADPFADADDLGSRADGPVSLPEHLDDVSAFAREFAAACLTAEAADAVIRAAELHDIGKADPRFQQMLCGGSELAALAEPSLLAKSEVMPRTLRARRRARELAGLPRRFRHEMLSVQLAERHTDLPADTALRDLVLHLIAAHHGFGRPFPPVIADPEPPAIERALPGRTTPVSAEERHAWPPPHHLDSGVADRYWRATRRFGWWGLAYLEAMLRLADWAGSAVKAGVQKQERETPIHAGA